MNGVLMEETIQYNCKPIFVLFLMTAEEVEVQNLKELGAIEGARTKSGPVLIQT